MGGTWPPFRTSISAPQLLYEMIQDGDLPGHMLKTNQSWNRDRLESLLIGGFQIPVQILGHFGCPLLPLNFRARVAAIPLDDLVADFNAALRLYRRNR
jgi:hypothetical protein